MALALDGNTIVGYLSMSRDMIFKHKLSKDSTVEALALVEDAAQLATGESVSKEMKFALQANMGRYPVCMALVKDKRGKLEVLEVDFLSQQVKK